LNVFRSTAWPVAEAMTSSALTLATGSFHGTVTGRAGPRFRRAASASASHARPSAGQPPTVSQPGDVLGGQRHPDKRGTGPGVLRLSPGAGGRLPV